MNGVGFRELLVIFLLLAIYAVPVAAGIWALATLQRIRFTQDVIGVKLDAIERLLRG